VPGGHGSRAGACQVSGSRGQEPLRRLHEDHLDLRAAREQRREEVTGADGITRTRVETGHWRQLMAVFGQVTVIRMADRAPGVENLHPAEAALSLPVEKHSHRLAAIESGRGSFEFAAGAISPAPGP
jgi:hypothetical protein